MTCLSQGFIGIKGECGTPTSPQSGLYVQNLTELSIANLDKMISEDKKSGFDALQNDIMPFAEEEVMNDFRTGFADRYEAKTIIENDVVGFWKKNLDAQPSEPTYTRGMRVQIDTETYTSFFIQNIAIHSQATGNVDVLIYDLTQNKLLDTITIASTGGEIASTDIYKKYDANGRRLDLLIATTSEMYETNISGRACCNKRTYKRGTARFTGAKVLTADNKIAGNLRGSNGTSGISITYSVNCDFDLWLCAMKQQLAIPYLYKIGHKIALDMQFSKRLNSITTLHRQAHAELVEYYERKYNETKTNILQHVQLPENRCFMCRRKTRTSVRLP